MAGIRISALPTFTGSPSDSDYLVIDTLVSGDYVTKKIAWATFLEAIVAQTGVLVDSEGNPFNPDSYDQAFEYDGSGRIVSITATGTEKTWVQTLTYGLDGVATSSNWVVQ